MWPNALEGWHHGDVATWRRGDEQEELRSPGVDQMGSRGRMIPSGQDDVALWASVTGSIRRLTRPLVLLTALAFMLPLTACSASGQPPPVGLNTTKPPATSLTPATLAGSLVFVDAGDLHVFQGTEATRLAQTPATEGSPRWSPDGSRIIFTRSVAAGGHDVFTMKSDGTGEEHWTTPDMDEVAAAWSPDGKSIAFSTFTDADGGAIWLMNGDGTKAHPIYKDQSAYVGFADWSPDGRSILIVIDRGGGGQLDLYKIGVDGKGLMQLTTAGGDDSGGRWSPDGDHILFWSDGNPQGPGIYLMNANGSQQRRILEDTLNANTVALAWSPDGKQIAWTAKYEGGGGAPIFLMASDGSRLQQLHESLTVASVLDWAG